MRKLLYLFAVALLFVPAFNTAQGRGGGGGGGGGQAQEQPLVNVQVLKGMTRPQVIQEMFKINTALGVACTFCHVQKDGRNDFPADDKQHKLIARDMMRMVQTINEQAAVKTVSRTVECWTCHRGGAGIPNPPPPAGPPAPAQGGGGGGGGGARGGGPAQQ
jgi:Photosynthetic reaction centre cytochrome C subunit